jgi:putative ABC transport system permease protein
MRAYLRIAARNALYQRNRYSAIIISICMAMAIMTFISGVMESMVGSLRDKAARYYSGHINLFGYVNWDRSLPDADRIARLAIEAMPGARGAYPRSVYYIMDCMLYFNGNSVRQRRLNGLDPDAEAAELARMKFIEGGWEGLRAENGVLLSRDAAEFLMCRAGDDILLYLTTASGQNNLVTLAVSGIFDESGIFGYAAYLNRRGLNRAMGVPENFASEVAVFMKDTGRLKASARKLRVALGRSVPAFPELGSKADLKAAIDSNQGFHLAIIDVDAQLSQIRDTTEAFLAISYSVLLLFLGIIAVGINNTIRMLLRERTGEIGAMRAMGSSRSGVVASLMVEALIVAVAAAAVGFAIGCSILVLASCVDLSHFQGAGMFLEKGRLRFGIDAQSVCTSLAIMLAVTAMASGLPARRCAGLDPAHALRVVR